MISKKIGIIAASAVLALTLAGCGNTNNHSSATSSSASEQSTSDQQQNAGIVGTYRDNQDKAAIKLNSDKTGRYVYADPTDPDTDDQLTWKKTGTNTYQLKLDDDNVTSPLTAKLNNGKLTLTGDDNWNTESFNRTSNSLNLDHFLAQAHGNSSTASHSGSSTSSTAKGKYGNQGPADVPSELQGTWYSTDDDENATVTFGQHNFHEKDDDDSTDLSLYKQDPDFLANDSNATDQSIQEATKHWGKVSTANAKGMHWFNIRGWTQTAGDGTSYAVHTENVDGQEIKVLVVAEGADYETEEVYYQTEALANKYGNKKFDDLNYGDDD